MDRRVLNRLVFGLGLTAGFPMARADEPLRIGVSLGLTGKYREPATMNQRGYELWRDDVNARGGLLGRTVELFIVDDQSNADRAKEIYRELTGSKPVDHVFGPYSTELVEATAPITEAAGYPLLAAGASADSIWHNGYRNLFAMLCPASWYTKGMNILALEAGLRTVAILAPSNTFGEDVVRGATRFAAWLKLELVSSAKLPQPATDLTPLLRAARDAGAEMLIVAGYWNEALSTRQAATQIGWTPRAFYATIGPAFEKWRSAAGASANGTFTTSTYEPQERLDYPGARKFDDEFRRHYGMEPAYQAATAYAAGQILEAAALTANSLDRAAVREALFELDTYSVVGRFAVDHTGIQVKRDEMIIQWQNGKKEIVWPSEIRTAAPIFGPAGS